ncbi:MAG: hypothetical protein LBK00_01705 [Treponema sp.]|jgi:hypothetical protein|nr:hypothetical protein [Treponema sp.]
MKIRLWLYSSQVLLLLLLLLCSCTRSSEEALVIPPLTNPLSSPVVGYGVVKVSYTRVVDEPNPNALSLGYLRQGAIIQVIERRSIADAQGLTEPWVWVSGNYQGWLQEAVIDMYDNEAQARTAAESLTK